VHLGLRLVARQVEHAHRDRVGRVGVAAGAAEAKGGALARHLAGDERALGVERAVVDALGPGRRVGLGAPAQPARADLHAAGVDVVLADQLLGLGEELGVVVDALLRLFGRRREQLADRRLQDRRQLLEGRGELAPLRLARVGRGALVGGGDESEGGDGRGGELGHRSSPG